MQNRPQKPVTTTIARAMLAILLLSIATTSFALLTLASSLNDAEAINVSGSLRMQSYRLAYDIQADSPLFNEHLDQFEQSLFSPSMAALEHWTVPADIQRHYYKLIDRWESLNPSLAIENETRFVQEVATFVDNIDRFVFELQEFSVIKLQILSITGGVGLSLILVIALFTIHFTQRKIVSPLNQLVAASQQVQNGDFDVRIDVKSDNELGILAGIFSKMAAELGKHYRNLEQSVNEKTRRLRHANASLQVLYNCSQELSVTRLTAQNFKNMLDTLVEIEGLTAVTLTITENSGAETVIKAGAGVATERYWHHQDLILDSQIMGQLHWQETLPCPDHALIDNVARLLGRGIYYNRAQKQADQLLLMEERATIARELHDSLAQSLSYLKIQVTLLKRQLAKQEHEHAEQIIAEIDNGLSSAYTQLRELLSTFRLTIKEANFGEALVEIMKPLDEQTDAMIIIDNQLSSLNLDAHRQVHLLQLIREATLNAIKHAQADEIIITCQQQDEQVNITICDDGLGFDQSNEKLNHYGLAIMAERADRLNGEVTITSEPEQGCCVTLSFLLTP
ncbi:nitrate/nitrite two-component system sensor histidine kinase NarQ [Photobacterium sanguinicancri]|uniref:Sensor protein n=1 Tax=Photobacterium sanguinicancri TaxID=875932 RepID=A0ABX4FY08_9GAMM|nr:nitrate/nitrite two-component system sensor histidine kinase NarQ [Photobacterium sanguinicancri]OZS43778.1 nitrate/nitrite two-component system sensor histidine kinase NarQ [Photobacterium sanguinicancri]